MLRCLGPGCPTPGEDIIWSVGYIMQRGVIHLKDLKDHYLNQWRQDHAEAEGPDEGDHEKNVHSAVDLVVAPVVRDQHIPEEVIFG